MTLGYTPSANDPLLVTFVATVVPGTPTAFNWSFGDGVFFNGTDPAYFTAVHHYPSAGGTFIVTVVVHEGSAVNATSLSITVIPAPLAVSVAASPLVGPSPLTVTFQATVSGGTGTYRSFTWSFGNGQNGSGSPVSVTYAGPGHYLVRVNATDSAGASVVAETNVTVEPGGTGAPPPILDAQDLFLVGGGAAIGAVVGVAVMMIFQRRLRARAGAEPARPTAPLPAAAPAVAPVGEAPPEARTPVSAPSPSSPVPSPEKRANPEALRISQRVVLHLSVQGVLGPHEVASLGFTQPGISKALNVRQNALTNVLRRLTAAGVIVEDVRHVQGQPRRLKVYQLTPRGEALARELRHPRPATGAPRRPGGAGPG